MTPLRINCQGTRMRRGKDPLLSKPRSYSYDDDDNNDDDDKDAAIASASKNDDNHDIVFFMVIGKAAE